MMGGARSFSEFGGMPQRHHSVGDYDHMRPNSGGSLQSFYANQRHQPRQSEAEQMMHAKRRMAAQRERELRNYHQEQQYNRHVSVQGKADRAISPNTMNEEDRRELIARQHRALYGGEGASFYEGNNAGDNNQIARSSMPGTTAAGRGPSPRAFDPFSRSNQPQPAVGEAASHLNSTEHNQQGPTTGPSPKPQQQRSRANSNSSPASNQQSFGLFDNNAQHSSRTSTTSPGEPSGQQAKTSTAPTPAGVAPIGTRPTANQAQNATLNKRSTTPLPSPLSYGFAPNEPSSTSSANERSTSAASNPATGVKESSMGMAWGSNSGVWGKNSLGAQASVWG
ncbi:MAG: hypothetical protein Q9195_002068 [Heterodermia aff. obscurata]